ncbi:MAG: putative baseplate assembly protein [Pyrinomonadaceae bacterium]
MREDCGCCEGIERVTPVSNENRPGLSALAYRAGTHATFLETMLARLTTQALPAPVGDEVQTAGPRPLLALKTRDADDASVALLDAWATVADVLTFYQERIANEGYLRTATERRSVTELANLVGYRPRPGVSSSAHLAYTLEDKGEVTILAGSRAASTPGPAELPQTFETAEDLYARAEWNVFTPRQTRPQSHLVRPKSPIEAVTPIQRPLYLKGTATSLKPNDPLLIDYDGKAGGQLLFRVMKVEPDNESKRTKVTLEPWVSLPPPSAPPTPIPPPPGPPLNKRAADIMKRYRDAEAFDVNPNTATAGRIIEQLDRDETLLRKPELDTKSEKVREYLEETALPPLREEHRLAREGNFTKLEPWIGGLVSELTDLSNQIAEDAAAATTGTSGGTGSGASGGGGSNIQPLALMIHASSSSSGSSAMFMASQASKLTATTTANKGAIRQVLPLLGQLTAPPSAPPRSKQQLTTGKSIAQAFSPASDNLPRLLGAFMPGASAALYKAWEALPVTQATPATVYALRTRASLFGNSAPLFQDRNPNGTPSGDPKEWTLIRNVRTAHETRRFRVNVIYSTTTDIEFTTLVYTARVDLLNSAGVVTSTASITRAIEDTATPLTFTLSEPVTLTVSGAASTNMQRITYTFNFTALQAVVAMRHDREQSGLHVSSTGNNPVDIDYDPVTGQNALGFPTPSMTAECSVSVLGASTEFTERPQFVNLDATYNKILPGGWVVIEKRPLRLDDTMHLPVQPIITRSLRVGDGSRADYGMTAKGTELELYGVWIDPAHELFENAVRKTTVYAESEQLELADETIDPVSEDVCGASVELGVLVAGLEAGRSMIITGERTDIIVASKGDTSKGFRDVIAALEGANSDTSGATAAGGNASTSGGGSTTSGGANGGAGKDDEEDKEPLGGIIASELVMLAGVEQSFDPKLPGDKTHTTLLFSTELAYCYKRDTVRIYGNVVRATHGETRTEVLGSGDASKAMQSFTLKQSPLTYVSAPTASGVESTLKVRVNDVLWRETDTLAGLTPLDREYVTKADEAGATTVVFGNGRDGARLPTGNENVRAIYRSGIGKGGNLKARQINQPTTKPLGVKEVVNPLAATGGADRESRDEARRNAPLAVMALDRLVSTRDYEDFSRTFAGVAKASAARLSDGRRRVVHVTIAGADDGPISPTSDLFVNLREALHKYGDPHQPVELATRHLKTLFVSANVKVHPDYLWESVEPKIRAALLERFSFYRRDLGQDALLSEAVASAQGVEGVVYVDFDIFDDMGEGTDPSLLLRLGEGLSLRRRVHAYLAHVESAAIVEDRSRIRPAQLVLLTPLVPDTLILKEKKKR